MVICVLPAGRELLELPRSRRWSNENEERSHSELPEVWECFHKKICEGYPKSWYLQGALGFTHDYNINSLCILWSFEVLIKLKSNGFRGFQVKICWSLERWTFCLSIGKKWNNHVEKNLCFSQMVPRIRVHTTLCCIELQLGMWVHAYPCLTNSFLANIDIEQTTMLLEIVRSFPRLLILWKSPFISLFCMIVVSHVRLEYVFTFRSSTPANQQTSRLVSISDLLVCQKSKNRITLRMMECS